MKTHLAVVPAAPPVLDGTPGPPTDDPRPPTETRVRRNPIQWTRDVPEPAPTGLADLGRRERVLVVDDDRSIRGAFVRVLERGGLETIQAADGASALATIGANLPDLVLLDCSMPRMSGHDVVSALRANPRTATLPVILVTGSGEVDDRVAGLAAGADDFLSKPVHPDELLARVRAHLRGRHAWFDTMDREWRARSELADALTRVPPGMSAEETATTVCAILAGADEIAAVGVIGFIGDDAEVLGTAGMPGWVAGELLHPDAATALHERAEAGPWSDDDAPGNADLGQFATAFAPLLSHDQLLGILVTATDPVVGDRERAPVASLLATAVDLAPIVAGALEPTVARRIDRAGYEAVERVIANREFEIHFQPIVDLTDRGVVGFEALTRFADGTSPLVAFADAGRVGLRGELESVTLLEAIRVADRLPPGHFLSLNASAWLLTRPDVQAAILGIDRPVVLELTEHERIDDYGAVRAALQEMKPGTRLAVDDAGAGYASLRHILTLRPDFIKLDRDWVEAVDGDAARQALISGLHQFGQSLDAQLVAEGIETEDEAAALVDIGVELAQGYLFARPAPASTFS